MKKYISLLLTIAFFSFTMSSDVVKKVALQNESYIKYYMYHPAHDWVGTSNKIKCAAAFQDNKIIKVAASVSVNTFDSGNESRDSHALEAMEYLKYPKVKFISKSIKYENDSTLNVTGNLTFHGATKSIVFNAKKKVLNKKTSVTGEFKLKMSEYGIEPPSLMLVATEDEFKIEFLFKF